MSRKKDKCDCGEYIFVRYITVKGRKVYPKSPNKVFRICKDRLKRP
ncbi:hypothetical protein [Persicitalea jodogahamensis]|nr:hypothetical protein [Persicitalea jodogahamensis]